MLSSLLFYSIRDSSPSVLTRSELSSGKQGSSNPSPESEEKGGLTSSSLRIKPGCGRTHCEE